MLLANACHLAGQYDQVNNTVWVLHNYVPHKLGALLYTKPKLF